MSVTREDYILLGVNVSPHFYKTLPVNNGNEDHFKRWVEPFTYANHESGLKVVVDGVSGEYGFIGKVLAHAEESEGLSIFCPEAIANKDMKKEVFKSIKEYFPIKFVNLTDIKIWVFTHWT